MKERSADDHALTRELDGLSHGYRGRPGDAPPAEVDAAVVAHARQLAGRQRRLPAWWVPAALAATVVIAFSLMLRVQQEAVMTPAGGEAAGPVPAATRAAPAEAPVGAALSEPSPQVAAQAPRAAPAAVAVPSGEPAHDTAVPEAAPARAAKLAPQAGVAAMRAPASAEADALPEPEAWLSQIEALEAEGRMQEAVAERERLEAAYPGWLEQRARSRD